MKNKKNYISNKEFTELIKNYLNQKKENPSLPIPNEIGECFIRLVNNIANKPNFRYYRFLDDLKSQALYYCCLYIDRFDYTKSENAFSYFTQIIMNAFIQMINKEKQLAIDKFKYMKQFNEKLADKYDYNNFFNEADGDEINKKIINEELKEIKIDDSDNF